MEKENNDMNEEDLKKKLEKEGEEKVKQLMKSNEKVNADTFLNIIKEGAAEFKEKTGREMSYSEMREMYG